MNKHALSQFNITALKLDFILKHLEENKYISCYPFSNFNRNNPFPSIKIQYIESLFLLKRRNILLVVISRIARKLRVRREEIDFLLFEIKF